jgi:hypothetical protein
MKGDSGGAAMQHSAPAPAISAIAATEIMKRLDIMFSPRVCLHCPRRQRKAMRDVPSDMMFHHLCFARLFC